LFELERSNKHVLRLGRRGAQVNGRRSEGSLP
jgi:hypothetical protein